MSKRSGFDTQNYFSPPNLVALYQRRKWLMPRTAPPRPPAPDKLFLHIGKAWNGKHCIATRRLSKVFNIVQCITKPCSSPWKSLRCRREKKSSVKATRRGRERDSVCACVRVCIPFALVYVFGRREGGRKISFAFASLHHIWQHKSA
jgi:hypothetical protein